MSDDNEADAAARRLEAALERIAMLSQRPALAAVANPPESTEAGEGVVDAAALAARLDALIAELRGALAR